MELTAEIVQREAVVAKRLTDKVKRMYANGVIKSWGNVANEGLVVPMEPWGRQPLTYAILTAFCTWYVTETEARLRMEFDKLQDTSVKNTTKLAKEEECDRFGQLQLLPEQQAVAPVMYDAIMGRKVHYGINDMTAGAGKTYVYGWIVHKALMIDKIHQRPENLYRLYPVQIYTRAAVVEQTKRVLEEAGLGPMIGKKILVLSYNDLRSAVGKMLWSEVENPVTGAIEIKWNPVTKPILAIFDEAHGLNREGSTQTQVMRSLMADRDVRCFGFTATPASVLKDLCTLLIANRVQYGGITATDQASAEAIIKKFDPTPTLPNQAAMKRIKPLIEPFMFRAPYVRWPHRGITQTLITEFATQADKDWYNFAHERYKQKLADLGRNPSSRNPFMKAIINNEFRRAVEPCRVPLFVERIKEAKRKGDRAIAIGTAYKETIIRTVFTLVDEGIWSRRDLCLVWGGSERFKPELLLSKEEFERVLKDALKNRPTREMIARLKETIRYWDDQKSNGETPEEQAARHRKLSSLGLLGNQSRDQRQREIDKFQIHGAPVCLFTLAAGGTGLSLHQHKLTLLPREGYFTPTYSGPEIKQALGRLPRRTSKSDTYQYICWMAGTVEEYHVAPRIDAKLKCIDELTNRNVNLFDELEKDVDPSKRPKFRNLAEAVQEAADDASQITNTAIDDDLDDDAAEPIGESDLEAAINAL